MKKIDKQLSYAPAEFQLSYCGWASPAMREMNGIFRQQLALLCYDQAKSVEELSQALQTPFEYIQDAVDSFCNANMMKKIDGKYLTIFPMLHLKKNYEAGLLCYKFSEEHEIPKKINDILFSLKDKIAALDFYGNDFDLSYLNWFLYTITDNCMISEFRSYFSDKTDEVIFNNSDWRTNNYNYSLCASYNYADEKIEDDHLERRLSQTSTYYQHLGNYRYNNVFDFKPFPCSFEENAIVMGTSEMGRNRYLTSSNIDFYLNLVKGIKREFTEEEKKCLEDFEKHEVVEKSADGYKPMIPVFTEEVFSELEKIITRAIIPIVKEIAEATEKPMEEIMLPEMRGVKERIDQLYVFWLCSFLSPRQELYWYGMNVEGLAIPKDYKASAAGLYIVC